MSGIGGIMLRAGSPSDPLLYALAKSLEHRGPDKITGEIYEEVGFVHAYLPVIDLEDANQPLHGDNLALIASGTIYNYVELRDAFPEYPFKTKSDFEPIFALYQQYGAQFVDHLRGMYTLALYDNVKKTLFLARDPFGIKSLYYWEGINGVAFSSETQAFFKANLLSPHLNREKVSSLLSFGYTWGRETLYQGIQRVMPGETIMIQKGRIQQRFLRPALPKGPPHKISLEAGLSAVDQILDRSVEVHLRGSVPIGLFLSGDLDSSCLLKLMSRHTSDPIKTFSVSISSADEKKSFLHLTNALKAEHQKISFDEKDFWALLPHTIATLDDPTLDMSAVLMYKMAKEATQSVKILLSSEGGSEIFGGHERYKRAKRPWWLGGAILTYDEDLTELGVMRELFPSLWRERDDFIPVLEAQNFTRLQVAQALDFEAFLPNDLLLKLDRCLMAHGVEGRTPYLDIAVAESFFNLPDAFKIKNSIPQWLLGEWVHLNFPEAEPFAKKKDFSLPISEWILSKGKEIGFLVAHQEGVNQLCHPDKVQRLFLSSNKTSQRFAWSFLCFALWHQIHILKIPPHEDAFTTLGKPLF